MNYQQSPTKEPKKRRTKKLPVFVSEKDLLEILKVSKHKHHKFAYMLGFYSGLRISEIVNLEPRNINFEQGTMLVEEGKGGKDRVAILPKFFRKEMLELMPLKKLVKQRALQKAFIKACEESGVKEEKIEGTPLEIFFSEIDNDYAFDKQGE